MPAKREVTPVLPWTGITVGHWATCSCTWGYRDGKPEDQVRARHLRSAPRGCGP